MANMFVVFVGHVVSFFFLQFVLFFMQRLAVALEQGLHGYMLCSHVCHAAVFMPGIAEGGKYAPYIKAGQINQLACLSGKLPIGINWHSSAFLYFLWRGVQSVQKHSKVDGACSLAHRVLSKCWVSFQGIHKVWLWTHSRHPWTSLICSWPVSLLRLNCHRAEGGRCYRPLQAAGKRRGLDFNVFLRKAWESLVTCVKSFRALVSLSLRMRSCLGAFRFIGEAASGLALWPPWWSKRSFCPEVDRAQGGSHCTSPWFLEIICPQQLCRHRKPFLKSQWVRSLKLIKASHFSWASYLSARSALCQFAVMELYMRFHLYLFFHVFVHLVRCPLLFLLFFGLAMFDPRTWRFGLVSRQRQVLGGPVESRILADHFCLSWSMCRLQTWCIEMGCS